MAEHAILTDGRMLISERAAILRVAAQAKFVGVGSSQVLAAGAAMRIVAIGAAHLSFPQWASQISLGQWAKMGFDIRSFVQQQDHYQFYAFPILDVPPGTTVPPDSTTDLIPSPWSAWWIRIASGSSPG